MARPRAAGRHRAENNLQQTIPANQRTMPTEAAAERIAVLRARLKDKPRSAKLHAKLAQLLYETEGSLSQEEATCLAQKAIDLAPEKPVGYGALANVAIDHKVRMEALQHAVDIESGLLATENKPPTIGIALALVKLLSEPRQEEAKALLKFSCRGQKSIGKASSKHPNRRDLNEEEQKIYNRLCDTLAAFQDPSASDKESLGWIHSKLGSFFRKLEPGEIHRPRSIHHFQSATKVLPSDHALTKKAKFWLTTLGESNVSCARCPEEYIVGMYSSFASQFDDLLVNKLKYKTPSLLRNLVDSTISVDKRGEKWASNAADLGCGTGLSGIAFRSCAKNMVGVDLSPEMVDKARERDCYEDLVVGDVEIILNEERLYDLIFACDVFVYIGDLESIFASTRRSLQSGGLFAFSTEFLEENENEDEGFMLHRSARFAHKRSYIENLAAKYAFNIRAIKTCPIRKNEGKDVKGILVVLS